MGETARDMPRIGVAGYTSNFTLVVKAVMQFMVPLPQNARRRKGRRTTASLLHAGLVMLAASTNATLGLAGPIKVQCQGESVLIPGWKNGTMDVAYDDAGQGTLMIKGVHVELTLPASMISMANAHPPSNIVSASGAAQALVPELAAVDNCVAGKISPDQKNDRDMYLNTALSCFDEAPASIGPVPVVASVKLGLMKGEGTTMDTWFEGEITYAGQAAGPGGKLTIPLMPGDCKVVP